MTGKKTITSIITECPEGLTRFQDHCFKYIRGQRKFSENLDECRETNLTLWNPESEEEHQFVIGTFSAAVPFHLGILMADNRHGWIGSDNSLFLGNSYYLSIKSSLQGVEYFDDNGCLIFDSKLDKYEFRMPCPRAFAICKTELGKKFLN